MPERQQNVGVHRVAAYLWLGMEWGSPLYVCHHCDNPLCFNPEHLFIGTATQNMQDAIAKKRIARRNGHDHHWAKMTDDDVRELRRVRELTGLSYLKLGRMYGISDETARAIGNRRTWKHLE